MKAYWEQMSWLGPENWGALPLTLPVDTTVSGSGSGVGGAGSSKSVKNAAFSGFGGGLSTKLGD